MPGGLRCTGAEVCARGSFDASFGAGSESSADRVEYDLCSFFAVVRGDSRRELLLFCAWVLCFFGYGDDCEDGLCTAVLFGVAPGQFLRRAVSPGEVGGDGGTDPGEFYPSSLIVFM